ncbi:hypothetical protein Godav_021833 [Gossypium davidsonii]|uniref:Uncharacterized protein n=1 Tax=Gossypium davidsonii TaxID=34287 RepID=A0A7J8T8C1_GOSDV|nr:hypothetical protein [Gossypium davidsonii]
MDTIRGFDNSGSNSGCVLPKSKRLACESPIGQLCDPGDAPVEQSITVI